MRVLVIGGSQFNGFSLVHELARRGHEVTVLNRGRTETSMPEGVRRLMGDRTDAARMGELFSGADYDCVYDTCAYHPADVEMMTDLLDGRTGHYVFLSSVAIYAPSRILPIAEDFADDRSPAQNEYGLHKLLCEDHLLEAHGERGFPATTVVLHMVMGPRNILPDREQRMFTRLLTGRPILILGDGTTLGQVGHVDDQAVALSEIMGRSETFGQRYNLTGGEYFTDEGYVDTFAEVTGIEPRKVFVPAGLVDDLWDGRVELGARSQSAAHIDIRSSGPSQQTVAAMRTRYQLANLVQKAQPNLHRWNASVLLGVDKLARDVGWRPSFSFGAAVQHTYDWFQREGRAHCGPFDFTFEDELLSLCT
jgi:nucleoside-diphosphate-sugar epimerase